MKYNRVIIIGGGLAGLTAAIDLSGKGFHVILFEKDQYPHHKVCGEYLSKEVLPYLDSLDIYLDGLQPPQINELVFSSNSGLTTRCSLEMGGLGLSRFTLDHFLYKKAKENGCEIINATVKSVEFTNNIFKVITNREQIYISDIALGAYGKRSNIDNYLDRDFFRNSSSWLAVKAHYLNKDYPGNLVSLHNFEGGYCGLSRTELNTINMCYLASYKSFKKYKNTRDFRNEVLIKNPRLKEFFDNSTMVFDKELTIAQVNFDRKSLVQDHILMIGDAAGLIHPLCGNGMAMAIHSAKTASDAIYKHIIAGGKNRLDLESNYKVTWRNLFEKRIKAGRILQNILLRNSISVVSQEMINLFPGLMPFIIKRTHGKPIYV